MTGPPSRKPHGKSPLTQGEPPTDPQGTPSEPQTTPTPPTTPGDSPVLRGNPTLGTLKGDLVTLPIDTLKPAKYNPRRISPENLSALAESITTLGYFDPVVINKDGTIISGHQRVKALEAKGEREIEVLRVDVPPRIEKLMNLAANSRGLQGEWDPAPLRALLTDLSPTKEEMKALALNKDNTLKNIISAMEGRRLKATRRNGYDSSGFLDPTLTPSTPGGLYVLGPHLLLCGDSRDPKSYNHISDPISLVVTSPPYGVGLECEGGSGKNKDLEANLDLVKGVLGALEPHLMDRGLIFWNVGVSARMNLVAHHSLIMENLDLNFRNLMVWDKMSNPFGSGDAYGCFIQNPYPSYYYPNQRREFLLVYQKGGIGPIPGTKEGPPIDLEWSKQFSTDTWSIKVNAKGTGHPAPFCVPLAHTAITLYSPLFLPSMPSPPWVCDPFGGSGTTLIGADIAGRRAFIIEIDPTYCDLIRARYKRYVESQGGSEWKGDVNGGGEKGEGEGPMEGGMED